MAQQMAELLRRFAFEELTEEDRNVQQGPLLKSLYSLSSIMACIASCGHLALGIDELDGANKREQIATSFDKIVMLEESRFRHLFKKRKFRGLASLVYYAILVDKYGAEDPRLKDLANGTTRAPPFTLNDVTGAVGLYAVMTGKVSFLKDLLNAMIEVYRGRCNRCHQPCDSLCEGCKRTYYCCAEHQRMDWKEHRRFCRVKLARDSVPWLMNEAKRLCAKEGGTSHVYEGLAMVLLTF